MSDLKKLAEVINDLELACGRLGWVSDGLLEIDGVKIQHDDVAELRMKAKMLLKSLNKKMDELENNI